MTSFATWSCPTTAATQKPDLHCWTGAQYRPVTSQRNNSTSVWGVEGPEPKAARGAWASGAQAYAHDWPQRNTVSNTEARVLSAGKVAAHRPKATVVSVRGGGARQPALAPDGASCPPTKTADWNPSLRCLPTSHDKSPPLTALAVGCWLNSKMLGAPCCPNLSQGKMHRYQPAKTVNQASYQPTAHLGRSPEETVPCHPGRPVVRDDGLPGISSQPREARASNSS